MFQLLNEYIATASSANPASRIPSRARSLAPLPALVVDNSSSRDKVESATSSRRGRGRSGRGRGRGRPSSRTSSRSSSYASSRSSSTISTAQTLVSIASNEQDDEVASLGEARVTIKAAEYRKHNLRPNLYTSLYYLIMIVEYSLGINL